MECDQSLKGIREDVECGDCGNIINRRRTIYTGTIVSVTKMWTAVDQWMITGEGVNGQKMQFTTTDSDAENVEAGQRFELVGNTIKIFSTDGH